MALTKIMNPSANNAYKPSDSALKTFASILSTGTTLAGLGSKAADVFNKGASNIYSPVPNPQNYTLGISTNMGGGEGQYMNSIQNTLNNSPFAPGQIMRAKPLDSINPGSLYK